MTVSTSPRAWTSIGGGLAICGGAAAANRRLAASSVALREYGYYVLPVLAGDRVAGRIEPRFDRSTGTLDVLGAWGETTGVEEPLAALERFLRR